MTKKQVISQNKLSKEIEREKRQRRKEIRILLLKLDTKYGDLTKVPIRDDNFRKLQSLLRGDDLDESVVCEK